jgi:ATP-dependent Clp protease ATP-binding subunit ClpC
MFECYTDRAKRSVELAQLAAQGLCHDEAGTDHLLLGLIGEGGGVAFRALDALGVTAESANEAVCRRHPAGNAAPPGPLPYTTRFRKVQELAVREAIMLGHNFIATEHLLLGLIRDADDSEGAQALEDCGIDKGHHGFLADVRAKVLELLRGYEETEKRAAVPEAADIQVVMTAGIQPTFKAWLSSRGLYLFPIPTEDDRLPTFGIGIR